MLQALQKDPKDRSASNTWNEYHRMIFTTNIRDIIYIYTFNILSWTQIYQPFQPKLKNNNCVLTLNLISLATDRKEERVRWEKL